MKRTAITFGLAATLCGCSSELDINAPYKDITIVYGLLDSRDPIQFIKVNKAFLGEGDAYVFAQIPDSNEWGDAVGYARVHRKLNGQVVATFDLRDTLITNREPGDFYSPYQRLYYFEDPFRTTIQEGGSSTTLYLDKNSEYELELKVKDQIIRATTDIIDDFRYLGPDPDVTHRVELMFQNSYGTFELNWRSGIHGKRYVASYRFNYREVRGTEVSDIRSFTIRLGTSVSDDSGETESMYATMDGQSFFNAIASHVPTDPTVTARRFVGLDFLVSAANDEFHTYLTLDEPVTGIIEDRPEYTNVENGYGLFGSRYTKPLIGKALSSNTMAELADGSITSHLNFCTEHPLDVNSSFHCP
ncbi:MAG: hypothetical protein IPH05_16305 [Flavobacteriales bacterium]|nr:hypothetical protein [Flavobacteriales bacterium]